MKRELLLFALLIFAAGTALSQGAALYTVTIVAEPPEGGMVTGEGRYAAGASVTVTAEAYPGFEFAGWWEEGVKVSSAREYTFTITSDRVLVARFEPVLFFEGTQLHLEEEVEFVPTLQLLTGYSRLLSGYRFGEQKWQLGAKVAHEGTSLTSVSGSLQMRVEETRLSGRVVFDPGGAAYRYAYLSLLTRAPNYAVFARAKHSSGGLSYVGSLRTGTLNLSVSFVDSTDSGFQFKSALLRVSRVPFCCDLSGSLTLSFTKDGFSYAKLKVRNLLDLCCGIALDAYLEITPESKAVSLEPVWKYAKACLKAYGNVVWDGEAIEGLEIYGFKISCAFGKTRKYPRLELVTALAPDKLSWARFEGEEFEYIGVKFRRASCCDGNYEFEARTYFSHEGTLLGISRIALEGGLPLGGILYLEPGFTANLVDDEMELKVGWEADL